MTEQELKLMLRLVEQEIVKEIQRICEPSAEFEKLIVPEDAVRAHAMGIALA
jgi:hypothetical protein